MPEGRILQLDGLELARSLPCGTLDLVYLDPPFGTGKARIALRGRGGRHHLDGAAAYEDPRNAAGGNSWLEALLKEMPRLLRPGGALFLHLDHRAVHGAKLFLDCQFGVENFLNQIIWHYATGGVPRNCFARKHDTILYYRNGSGHTFHRQTQKKYLAHRMSRKGVEEYHDNGGWYRYKYLDDVWEIPWLTQDSRERTGYPTQKPYALLERILSAATNPGDLVADFCCGSGTTAAAAESLGRRWVACDTSPLAVKIAEERLALLRSMMRGARANGQLREEEQV